MRPEAEAIQEAAVVIWTCNDGGLNQESSLGSGEKEMDLQKIQSQDFYIIE